MKQWPSVLILLFAFSLFANDEPLDDIQISKEEHVLDKRENYFLTATDYRITPKVNPITGEYQEEECDFIVAGSEPLSIRRFYNSSAPYDARYASWRYNPESFLAANLEWKEQSVFAAVGESDGSVISLNRSNNDYYLFNFELSKNFSNFQPDGKTHPFNTHMHYWKIHDPKDKHRFQYIVTVTDGSGRTRQFVTSRHRWTHNVSWREKKGNRFAGSEIHWQIRPNTWTPFHIPITEEKLPNGNILVYSYTLWQEEEKNYPYPQLLSSITAYNHDKTKILGSIQLHYPRGKHQQVNGIQMSGSDGRSAFIQHMSKDPILLGASRSPHKPSIDYGFQKGILNRVERPDGRVFTTYYNQEKVSEQHAPVGSKGEMCSIGRYEYYDKLTNVYDAENNKTSYRYDENKKISAIEVYQGNTLYRVDRFFWDLSTGNLTRKTVEDSTGASLQIIEYEYDKNQNPILERIGDGKEWRSIYRTFSDDGFNLKLTEKDRDHKLTRYSYIPGTNLLSSELVYEDKTIRKRTFYTYDDCAICIKTITDDGSSDDPHHLQNVTYRKITQITPKQTTPCFGLPEIIVEKTIEPSGQEILLHKTIYIYTPFGKVLKEDHYDSSDTYRYSITNTYDTKECLTSTIDPLGHKTTFTYDANHNITSISGPRDDQYKEMSYDKANRPIRIANWQTDGTVLIRERRYNKLGQVIAEIDPCNKSTLFNYDALGRVIAIHYPDGAIERKEWGVFGNATKEIDPEGHATTKIYNPFGQILSINYPDGAEEHYRYHSTGTIHSHTDKNGATTVYTYDIFDHPIHTETYSSSGNLLKSSSATWSPFLKLSETDADLKTLYIYDFAGRKIGEQKAYHETKYAYDALGRLAYTQNETIRQIKEYDLCDHPILVKTENANLLQKQEAYAYDSAGNQTQTLTSQGKSESLFNTDGKLLRITDLLGHTTQFSYSHGDIVSKTSTNPNGIQTVITYNNRGKEVLRLKKNRKGEVIQYSESSYNKNGNPIQLTHTIYSGTVPIKKITHFWEYGPQGRLERFVESGEKETRYLYDTKGRLQLIIKPDGSKLNHAYDDLGRLVRYQSTDFDYQYAYDARNRVTSVWDAISNTRTFRAYDPLSNIEEEILANGLKMSNDYDSQARRMICKLPDTSTIHYGYDGIFLHTVLRKHYTHTYSEHNLEGQITHAVSPAGEIDITRDALGRYSSLSTPHFSAQNYQYDPVGNLLHYTYKDTLGEAERYYTYDDLDQLIQEDDQVYQFDSLFNRLKKDSYEYAINSLCQVTDDGKNSYSYDLCGNLIADGIKRYTYDSLDRLIAVEDGTQKTEYTYDPFHRRLTKTSYLKGCKQNTIRYLWDGNHEIGIVDEQNRIRELRILGEGLGAEIGAAVLLELDGKSYVPIHDHRGCIVTLIDPATQKSVECYRYSAFGEEQTEHTLSPWRFSSKRIDPETGFVFFGRRYYDPDLGRWITQDPQGFGDGPNLYAYVHNCPLNQIDFYGLLGIGQCFNSLSRWTFKTLEWTGANLVPIPFVRNLVESVGRWGAGGDFRGPSRYRFPSEVVPIPGRTVPGHSYNHINGMLTSKDDAIRQAEYISEKHGGVKVDLMYHGTQGFIMDLIGCGLAKLGLPTSFSAMCADYYKTQLHEDPNHRFTTSVHSRGGIHLMSAGRLMQPEQRKHIDVIAYGSATLIPKGYFGSAINNLSYLDIVTMTNPLAFCMGLMGIGYDIKILSPSTHCPYKAHGFLEATYAEEIAKRGGDFMEKYFNE